MLGARARGGVAAKLRVESDESHTVLVREHQPCKTGRATHSEFVLAEPASATPAVPHRTAAVKQNRAAKIGFFFIFADIQAIGLAEELPVDRANIGAPEIPH